VGSHDGKLYALNPDGTEKWSYQTGGQITSSPAINGEDCVYITSVDGYLHAVRLDGSVKWKLKTGGVTESSPVISRDGTIYLGVNDDVMSVTAAGEERWRRAMVEYVDTSPVIGANDVIYAVQGGGALVALGTERQWRWDHYLYGYCKASPTLCSRGRIYVTLNWNFFGALPAGAGLADSVWPKFRSDLRNTGRLADDRN
jgi:outer membrane protein assembly factor BamB